MISCTLNQYKESFKTNLSAYLNEYEDNTKTFFLQNEKKKYKAYQNALTKISNKLDSYSSEELKNDPTHCSIASDLKKINLKAYNKIVTELKNGDENKNEDNLFSLSKFKNDRIHIDSVSLENHIKSSIVILKFISNEYEIAINTKTTAYTATSLFDDELPQIDEELWQWLEKYRFTNEYLSIPMMIEEKADYVIDTYKNYEERNFKYQLEICNKILEKVPNEETIIEHKIKYEKKLIDLRKQFPIPDINIDTIISDINNAFYRLEKFMEGSVSIYQSFLFNDTFTLFFNELNKIENITVGNHALRDGYHNLLCHIDYAFDKSEFKNHDAYDNDDFNRDCNEICYIHFYRSLEFGISNDLDDYKFEMPSIVDLIKEPENNAPEIINIEFEDTLSLNDETNPYPRIFTSHKGFDKFKNLKEEFGDTKQNLSNYSFVYHRMVKDKFIYDDYKQKEFVFFLLDFDINISRIKPKTQLGNNDLRESIYNSLK